MALPVITLILCFKQALYQSLFRNTLPRRPMANVDAQTTTVNALPMVLHAVAVARRTTGYSSVEALGGDSSSGCTPSSGRTQKQRQRRPSGSKPFSKGRRRKWPEQVLDEDMKASHTRPFPSQLLVICQDHHTLPK